MASPGATSVQDDVTVRTDPILVAVRLVSGAEVTGYVHVKPDSCHTRVSDLLNRGVADFLPITRATMERPDGHVTSTDCMIVRREQIEIVALIEEGGAADHTPAGGIRRHRADGLNDDAAASSHSEMVDPGHAPPGSACPGQKYSRIHGVGPPKAQPSWRTSSSVAPGSPPRRASTDAGVNPV